MNNKKKILLLIFVISGSAIFGQEQFRVMTYNVLNYPSKISSTRNPYFAKVIEAVNPDILIVQEMESITGVTMFHEDVLDSSYSAGAFINGNDTDNALFYKDSLFDFIDNTPIKTALRDIAQLTLVYKNSGDTLIIYSAHLKASDGTTNEQKRLAEVNNLRTVTDKLPPNMNYMLVGDFNFYNSTEPGFQKLLDKTNTGYFLDPINKIANWHNNSAYRSIHTQSTRLTSLADEGSTGGLDDRFDMILVSQAVIDSGSITYLPNSYTTFGNDGNHFNRALIELPNAAVSNDIATALYYASDHLPVYADFVLEPLTSIKDDEAELIIDDFELFQNYPNPFNPTTIIKYTIPKIVNSSISTGSNVELKVFDVLGRELKTLVNQSQKPGNHEIIFNAENLSSGIYFYTLKAGSFYSTKKMLLIK